MRAHIVFKFCLLEVLVNKVCAVKELGEVVVADKESDGHPDGAPERVASAHPVPELEHVVFRVDPELGNLGLVCRQGDEMLGNSRLLKHTSNT